MEHKDYCPRHFHLLAPCRCGAEPEPASSGNSELLNAIESLEYALSDDGGMIQALTLGCKHLNNDTSPISTLR